jgi:hypothetical protein
MKNHEKRIKNKRYAARMSRLRSATVEPVLGTLINFTGMKRVNTRGIDGAEKHVLMASLCYNLKKLLKFNPRNVESAAIKVQAKIENLAERIFIPIFRLFWIVFSPNKPLFFCFQKFAFKICPCLNVPIFALLLHNVAKKGSLE